MNISVVNSINLNEDWILLRPARWCNREWKDLASLSDNFGVLDVVKRIAIFIPLVFLTLGSYLISLPVLAYYLTQTKDASQVLPATNHTNSSSESNTNQNLTETTEKNLYTEWFNYFKPLHTIDVGNNELFMAGSSRNELMLFGEKDAIKNNFINKNDINDLAFPQHKLNLNDYKSSIHKLRCIYHMVSGFPEKMNLTVEDGKISIAGLNKIKHLVIEITGKGSVTILFEALKESCLESLTINISGSGTFSSKVPFKAMSCKITGSGSCTYSETPAFKTEITSEITGEGKLVAENFVFPEGYLNGDGTIPTKYLHYVNPLDSN